MDLNRIDEDTIAAIATPLGEGGIGIIRISGPEALPIAQKIFRPDAAPPAMQSHHLYHGWILDPSTGERVDEVLLSYMAAPRTYTREDVVEINGHSGYAVLDRVLGLVIQAGARLASPGEFTRRAFLGGRIDLSQAEAVIDLIHSRCEKSLALATRQLQGEFRDRVLQWRETLLHFQAAMEASMDFSGDLEDEEGEDPAFPIQELERRLIIPLQELVAQYNRGRVLREGFTLVLVGKPNVGKSSLLNALLGKDRAIVAETPGTTRDVIEDAFVLSGILVRILDTAGIRHAPDAIESLGIERTLHSVDDADAALWLLDQSRPLTPEDDTVYESIASRPHMVLLNKHDLPPVMTVEEVKRRYPASTRILELSAFNPQDIGTLREHLATHFLKQPMASDRSVLLSNLRHRDCFVQAVESLLRAGELLASRGYGELAAEELRSARSQLEAILGWGGSDEELLDRIFSQFCIGK